MQTRSSPNVETLRKLAKHASIEDYEKMPKTALFKKLKESRNLDRLMRAEKRASLIEKAPVLKRCREESDEESGEDPVPSSKAKRPRLNKIDPIMLTPIGKKKTFKFTRPNGTIIQYQVDTLIDYLLSSGDFIEPESRIPLSDEHLTEIDSLAKDLGLNKPSVLAAKNNTNLYSQVKFKRDALLALERCAGESITDMLDLVENEDPEEAQAELLMKEFPTFTDYFRQMRDSDREYAAKCMAHWRLFIAGPPNRPNKDRAGLLQMVKHFLKNCEQGNFVY